MTNEDHTTTAPDSVNHPSHYETNGIECIDAMTAAQGVDAVQDFCICNAFKYVWRHKHKNGAEDIKKAVWYLTKWLELEGGNKEVIHAPTIDAEPVKHGRWIIHREEIFEPNRSECYMNRPLPTECSVCGFAEMRASRFAFCPNCGTKMDGDGT